MNQPPAFRSRGMEARTSELAIVPAPMAANSIVTSKSLAPSWSSATRGSSVCHVPMMTSAVANRSTKRARTSAAPRAKRKPSRISSSVSRIRRPPARAARSTGGTRSGSRKSSPTPMSAACTAKLPPMPWKVMTPPAMAGPAICDTFWPRLLSEIALSRRCDGTTAGTSACRTGCPTATPTPTRMAIAVAMGTLMRSVQMNAAVSSEAASTSSWLPKSSARRSARSVSAPAGSVRKKTGMPSANTTMPSANSSRVRSPTRNTKVRRWMPCTSA